LPIPNADLALTRAEPNDALGERDGLFERSSKELALPESKICEGPVAIERERRLEFRNGLGVPALGAQHIAHGVMRKRAAR
jgi:hypothetical protein